MNTLNCVDALLERTAKTLATEPELLMAWLDSTPHLPIDQQIRLLHLMNKYQLDPWSEELVCYRDEAQEIHLLITIDGWYKIINQQASFSGMSLREATTCSDGIPDWIECCIYRHDRILPIIVKEYLIELQTSQDSWQQMPRRMLRHRAIQQCARLAFGISTLESNRKKYSSYKLGQTMNEPNSDNTSPPLKKIDQLKALLEITPAIEESISSITTNNHLQGFNQDNNINP